MKALCLNDALSLKDVPRPEPGPGEALVRVLRAGICNTDLEIARGYMGFRGILGHELLGVVESAPDPALVGARVTAEINLPCGACAICARGLGRHCPTRTVMGILGRDGCLAEKVALPVANLHRVPDSVPDAAAIFAEPLAAAFEILEQVDVEPGQRAAVLGDGKLGLLCAMVLASTGARTTLIGRHPHKLAIAREAGVTTVEADRWEGSGYDLIVEATGSPAGLPTAVQRVRPRGTVVLKSTFHGVTELDAAPVVIHEITVVGSRCGPFLPALSALSARSIDPTPLIDEVLPLSQATTAMERAAAPGALKIVVAPD